MRVHTSRIRACATSQWLLREARCRAVKPSSFLASTSCRARARTLLTALWERGHMAGVGASPEWPSVRRSLAASCVPTPNSQHVALEGRVVQQGEALAVGGSDVDAGHRGEDLHDGTGAGTR